MSYSLRTIRFRHFRGGTGRVRLGPVTLVTGPNGAGKSRVLDAAVVAITGKHPSRHVKRGDLFTLATTGAADYSVGVDLEDEDRDEDLRILRRYLRPEAPVGLDRLEELAALEPEDERDRRAAKAADAALKDRASDVFEAFRVQKRGGELRRYLKACRAYLSSAWKTRQELTLLPDGGRTIAQREELIDRRLGRCLVAFDVADLLDASDAKALELLLAEAGVDPARWTLDAVVARLAPDHKRALELVDEDKATRRRIEQAWKTSPAEGLRALYVEVDAARRQWAEKRNRTAALVAGIRVVDAAATGEGLEARRKELAELRRELEGLREQERGANAIAINRARAQGAVDEWTGLLEDRSQEAAAALRKAREAGVEDVTDEDLRRLLEKRDVLDRRRRALIEGATEVPDLEARIVDLEDKHAEVLAALPALESDLERLRDAEAEAPPVPCARGPIAIDRGNRTGRTSGQLCPYVRAETSRETRLRHEAALVEGRAMRVRSEAAGLEQAIGVLRLELRALRAEEPALRASIDKNVAELTAEEAEVIARLEEIREIRAERKTTIERVREAGERLAAARSRLAECSAPVDLAAVELAREGIEARLPTLEDELRHLEGEARLRAAAAEGAAEHTAAAKTAAALLDLKTALGPKGLLGEVCVGSLADLTARTNELLADTYARPRPRSRVLKRFVLEAANPATGEPGFWWGAEVEHEGEEKPRLVEWKALNVGHLAILLAALAAAMLAARGAGGRFLVLDNLNDLDEGNLGDLLHALGAWQRRGAIDSAVCASHYAPADLPAGVTLKRIGETK